jgi:hypothetical protein
MKRFTLTYIVLFAYSVQADQAVQSDWASGPGYPGPVTSWDSTFGDSENISWASISGQLALSSDTLADPVMHIVETGVDGAYTADTGDINKDGLTDIAAGSYAGGELCVWYADGSGGWERETVSGLLEGPCGCDVVDIDGDQDLDILCATYIGGRVLLYQNDGTSSPQWTETVICQSFEGGHDVEGCDMDGDGDMDILAASAESDRVNWWRNDGGSPIQWHEQNISDSVDYPCRVQAADLDGDGCMDVVASMWQGSKVTAWYGSGGGTPTWTEQEVYYPVYGAHSVRVCDVDDDTDPDLVVSEMGGGRLLLFRNGGGSPVSWTREVISTFPSCAYARTGDMDGDGDQDILTSSFATAGARWYENDGNGGTWSLHQVASGQGSISCAIPADVDDDGDLDALLTAYGQDKVLWFEVSGFKGSGWLESSILDTGEYPQWASIDWDATLPAGTGISVSYRTSDNPGSMGDWSDPFSFPTGLSGLVSRYFQYRVELNSSSSSVSPLFRSMQFNWDPNVIEGTAAGGPVTVTLPGGNPLNGRISVMLSSSESCSLNLAVFDLSGRSVWSSFMDMGSGDERYLMLPSLPSGAYRLVVNERRGPSTTRSIILL